MVDANEGQEEQLPVEENSEVVESVVEEQVEAVEEPVETDLPEELATDSDEAVETVAEADSASEESVEEEESEPVAEVTDGEEEDSESVEEATEEEAEKEEEATEEKPVLPVRRGELLEGTITKTTPTLVEITIKDDLVGIVPGRELERMSRQSLEELKEGQQITVFVVNPRDHRGNIVLSINRAIEELDWKRAAEYSENQEVYEGHVAGYNKGGLIVRFGRLRGFVPQSQIGEDRRRGMDGSTPEERYSNMVNESIIVKVMEVDRSRNRLILSERAASRERREKRKAILIEELTVGEIREGRVVSLEDFGAFVDVGGAEGLVHLTEITWRHVTHPRDVLKVGETVKVEVISIDRDRKRIGLSMKRQEIDPWDEVATTYQVGDLVQASVTKLTKFGAFAQLIETKDIEGLVHISELSDHRVAHPREVVEEGEKLTLRVVKIDVKNRRLGLSLKRVNSAEYLDHDMKSSIPTEADTEDE